MSLRSTNSQPVFAQCKSLLITLEKGYFAAERMLLLAFNNDAAAELRGRVKARLEPLGRAKASVTLITIARKESAFIAELVKDHNLEICNLDGSESSSDICPVCQEGFLVKRKSRYGPFYGCSRFPRCAHKEKLGSAGPTTAGYGKNGGGRVPR